MFRDPEVRRDVTARLTSPSMDWGPALPENFRKYSVDRNLHPGVANMELGDDNVFGGGQEMKDRANPEEKVHLVHFRDKVDVEGEQGQGDGGVKVDVKDEDGVKVDGAGDGVKTDEARTVGDDNKVWCGDGWRISDTSIVFS